MDESEIPSAAEFITRHKVEIASGRVRVKAKDILQTGTHWHQVEQATHKIQSNNPKKVLIIERLRWLRFAPKWEGAEPRREHEPDEISYRVGYRVVSRGGKWWWGQFSAMIPHRDFQDLLDAARDEGTLLPPS